jgi:hypothetical protein
MIVAFYALHYGSDYLGWSIKSIYDYVDKIYILYSDVPSYGYNTSLKNPDTKEKLIESAHIFGDPQSKIKWIDSKWSSEVQHRLAIHSAASQDDPDVILTVDADEIWQKQTIENTLSTVLSGTSKIYKIKMLTLWRSFSWYTLDNWWPLRVECPKRQGGAQNLFENDDSDIARVLHFGYARSLEDIRYKVSIHGHKGEWRSDWLDRYEKWPASGNNDFHPVCANAWNIMPYDKTKLPQIMQLNPYYNLDIIK